MENKVSTCCSDHIVKQYVSQHPIYLILVVAWVVDKQPADYFAAAAACLDVVAPLASVESLVLKFE